MWGEQSLKRATNSNALPPSPNLGSQARKSNLLLIMPKQSSVNFAGSSDLNEEDYRSFLPLPGAAGQIQLWQFLLELLDSPHKFKEIIVWEGIFTSLSLHLNVCSYSDVQGFQSRVNFVCWTRMRLRESGETRNQRRI